MSGKTTLLKQILENNQTIFDKPPTKIYYYYSVKQPLFLEFDNIEPPIEFINEIPSEQAFLNMNEQENNLVILDDLMQEVGSDDGFLQLITKMVHHKNISTVYITQNLFHQSKNNTTINKNCHYLFICNNPADRLTAFNIGRRAYPGQSNFFKEVHQEAVENKTFGYLLMDFHQKTKNNLRLLTDIFNLEDRKYFKPKNC
jgi:hypothetical protein